jgi:hypothetical protein
VVVGVLEDHARSGQAGGESPRVAGVERVADQQPARAQAGEGAAERGVPAVRLAHAVAAGLVDVVDDEIEAAGTRQVPQQTAGVRADDRRAERVEGELAPRHVEDLGIEVDGEDLGVRSQCAQDADHRAAADAEEEHPRRSSGRQEQDRCGQQIPGGAGGLLAVPPHRGAGAVDEEERRAAAMLDADVGDGGGVGRAHGRDAHSGRSR